MSTLDDAGLARSADGVRASSYLSLMSAVSLTCAGYYGAGIVALALRLEPGGISTIWLPHGILLAVFLLTPIRLWWLHLAALLPVHLHLVSHFQGPVPFGIMLIQFSGNVAQAMLGAIIVQRFIGAARRLDEFRHMTVFLVLGVILPVTLVSALVAELFSLAGWVDDFRTAWHRRTLTGVCGAVALTPLIVQMVNGGMAAIEATPRRRRLEYAALTIGLVVLVTLALSSERSLASQHALLFAPLPLLLWTAVRFGPGSLSLHLLIVALAALVETQAGQGPFIAGSAVQSVLSVNTFLLSMSVPLLLLAALVAERSRSGEALRESEERLRLALAAGRMGAWDWNRSRNTFTWSREHFAIMGLTPFSVEPTYDTWVGCVHVDDRPRVQAAMEDAIAERRQYRCEYRVVWPDGTIRWVGAAAEPIYGKDGRCVRVMGLIVDITERRRVEEALQASEERYREVVESQTELVCRYLPDTTLTFVNGAYCRFFGRRREELIGRKFLELIPEKDRAEALEHVSSLAMQVQSIAYEHQVLMADGSTRWQEWTDHTIRLPNGAVELQGIGRDITDRKQAEEANQRLTHLSRVAMLGELSGSLAHELNQPLTAILANAQAAQRFLANAANLDEIGDILNDIVEDDKRAGEVIRRLRVLFKREEPQRQSLDLNEVVRDVMRLMRTDLMNRNVTVGVELASDLPHVLGDRVHMQQVLLNLVMNACEAMADGGERLPRLLVQTSVAHANEVEVAVIDEGRGIAPDDVERIFEPFVTTKPQGMGLGLAVCRTIIQAHGGRLWAANNDDRGAGFYFKLPSTIGENS